MDWAAPFQHMPVLLEGLAVTIWITVVATVCSLCGAMLIIIADQARWLWLRWVVRIYTEAVLGIPILVLLYIVYFVLPDLGLKLGEVPSGVLTLTLYYSPYMAEVLRGALGSIPSGHHDAGRMIGLSDFRVLTRITLPQAIGIALPGLTGLMIGLAKDTAILSVISVHEFTYETKLVVSRTYAPFEVWTVVAAIYWVLLTGLEQLTRLTEHRLNRFREVR